MKGFKVVINEPNDFSGESYHLLEGFAEVVYGKPRWECPQSEYYSQEELAEMCKDADAVIGTSRESYTRAFMEKCPRLRIVSKVGCGTDKIDLQAANELGIVVSHTPIEENFKSVAEHTVTLLLASLRKLNYLQSHFKLKKWKSDDNPDNYFVLLMGKTIGLVGFGRIGQRVYRLLSAWEVNFLVYDPYLDQKVKENFPGVSFVNLDELLKSADIVSLHMAGGKDTVNLLNKERLSLLKPTAYFINAARGHFVDEEALTELLINKKIAGAGLDVFINEPPDFESPLFSLENVVASPHAACQAAIIRKKMWETAIKSAISALQGEVPFYIKNPEVMPSWHKRIAGINEL